MSYVTKQAVLQEAGLWHRELGEVPSGDADGTNTAFTVAHKPLTDNNYDDAVNKDDVVLYVNGAPVTVASIDATTGTITASSAPTNGADVTADYSFTSIQDDFVEDLIEEAEDVIDTALQDVATTPFDPVPARVRLIARTLAAGLLMAREYGLQADEESSKAARAKIKQAEAWLATYKQQLTDNSSTEALPVVTGEQKLFQRYDASTGKWGPLADEHFTVNEAS